MLAFKLRINAEPSISLSYTVLYWKLNEENGKEMDDLLLLVIQDVLNGSSYQFRKEKQQKKGGILIEMVLCVIHLYGGVWIAVIESDRENGKKKKGWDSLSGTMLTGPWSEVTQTENSPSESIPGFGAGLHPSENYMFFSEQQVRSCDTFTSTFKQQALLSYVNTGLQNLSCRRQQYRWDDHALSDEREQILMLSLALYNVCCWNVSFY